MADPRSGSFHNMVAIQMRESCAKVTTNNIRPCMEYQVLANGCVNKY